MTVWVLLVKLTTGVLLPGLYYEDEATCWHDASLLAEDKTNIAWVDCRKQDKVIEVRGKK